MKKRKQIFFGGHLVFCANLFSAVVLEQLYQSCSNLVHQFIIKKDKQKKNIFRQPSCFLCKSYFSSSFKTAVPILLKFGTPIYYKMTKRRKKNGWRPFCYLCKSYFCCSFRTAVPILLKFGTPIYYKMTS